MLAVIETHPVQYHAPVYRALQTRFGVPVTALYGSDFSVKTYRDTEFSAEFRWDTDLLGGYSHRFLSEAIDGREPDLTRLPARGLARELRALAPAATLIAGYSPSFHRHAWYAAWRLGRPILFRGETSDVSRGRGRLLDAARRAALRMAYRSCARVLYIGERSRRHYLAHGVPASRLVFSPYCVDTAAFVMDDEARQALRGAARRHLGIDDSNIVVLFSGKLSARKGVSLLVAAARRLPDAIRRRVVLAFVGDGALREALRAEAAAAPRLTAMFLGFQSQRELSRFYHMADVLALPSLHGETWGLVVNEALHHGLPVIVSDRVGCAPDLVGPDTGVVCRAGSVDALTEAIAGALRLVGDAGTRVRCRQRVAGYSVEQAAAGIAAAYLGVTGRSLAA